MRRWNGWGEEQIDNPAPAAAVEWLAGQIGVAQPPQDAPFDQVIAQVPTPAIPVHPLITTEPGERLRHARGHSLPDWIALRFGRIGMFPAGVARPETEEHLTDLFDYARRNRLALIPYGGGTSVVGGINPEPTGLPSVTVDLSQMNRVFDLDETSQLATFGAGVRGPQLEAALQAHGYTLGHFPQSFEYSTLGGWIATRSSGQQSLHYGRIEDLFAGGRLVAPAGAMEMLPYPASAAGPDLRQLVLGSEGRMGIISRATVRISPLPEHEEFHAVFFREWESGVRAVRAVVQTRLPLSMLRLSDPHETEATLRLAGHEKLANLAHKGLGMLGYGRNEKCLLLFAATGRRRAVHRAVADTLSVAGKEGGIHTGQYMGNKWQASRFLSPYMRNSLWDAGYAIDTLETVVPWADVLETAAATSTAIEKAGEEFGERVFVFAHLSHLYPTGASIYTQVLFRVLPDPDKLLELWRSMKRAASEAVVIHGGTISHQHGVGTDHAPYLNVEKGALGMALLQNTLARCDPKGIMNPGKLLGSQKDPQARSDSRQHHQGWWKRTREWL